MEGLGGSDWRDYDDGMRDKKVAFITPNAGPQIANTKLICMIHRMSALGQKQTLGSALGMSALPPKADIGCSALNVR